MLSDFLKFIPRTPSSEMFIGVSAYFTHPLIANGDHHILTFWADHVGYRTSQV